MLPNPLNCWEFMRCGRERNGTQVAELGVCPAALDAAADGFLGGQNGGRACAYIAGTFCGGSIQSKAVDKLRVCTACEFHALLRRQHGSDLSSLRFLEHRVRKTLRKEDPTTEHAATR